MINKIVKSTFVITLSLGIIGVGMLAMTSCSNFNELEPTVSLEIDINKGVTKVSDLKGLLIGAYYRMSLTPYYGRDVIIMGDAITDNLYSTMNSGRFPQTDMNYNPENRQPWGAIYQVIAVCNVVINAEESAISGYEVPEIMDQIKHYKAQAKTLRALTHFDLLRLYGSQFISGTTNGLSGLGVPYIKEYSQGATFPYRQTVQENLQDIFQDIDDSISDIQDSMYISTSYISKWAAKAIGARVALYAASLDNSYYTTALTYAEAVINSGYFSIPNKIQYPETFRNDNYVNSIFEISLTSSNNRGNNSLANILRGSYGDIRVLDKEDSCSQCTGVSLREVLPTGGPDVRATLFGPYQGHTTIRGKHMNNYSNVILFRIEEMYLIAAEAKFNLGDTSDALSHLNQIATNRSDSAYTEATMDNIMLERRKEFFAEGLRFYDLSRTGKDMPLVNRFQQLNYNLGPPTYGEKYYTYPIPAYEIRANANMIQNYGY